MNLQGSAKFKNAWVVELVDTSDLDSDAYSVKV